MFENPNFSISLSIFCSHELSSKRLGHKDFWYFKTKHGDFSSLSFSNNNSFGKPIHLNTSHSKNLSESAKRIFDLRGWPRIIANPVIKLGCLEFWHLLTYFWSNWQKSDPAWLRDQVAQREWATLTLPQRHLLLLVFYKHV